MALREREDSMTYVGVYDGKLEVRVDKKTPGAIEREKTKAGKATGDVIHVKNYGSLEGTIKDIKKDVKEFPDGTKFSSLKIFIDDMGDKYVLNWPYNSDLTTAFNSMVENIDLDSPLEFSVGKGKNKKGKEKTSLFLKQNGANIKWRYTREYQYADGEERKPEWEQVMRKGELEWDNSKEIIFFEKILKEKIIPKLRNKSAATSRMPASQESLVQDDGWIPDASHMPAEPDEVKPPDDSDLPF